MLNYSVMNGISKSSAPAKLVIEAAFKNYESISLELIMQPVRREDLVLGVRISLITVRTAPCMILMNRLSMWEYIVSL